jgi:hypothetical protein
MTEYVTIEKEVYETLLKIAEEYKDLKIRVEELEKRLWIYENPNVPPSKKMNDEKKKEEKKPQEKRGAPEGHLGATRKQPKPNRFIDLKPDHCDKCGNNAIKVTGHESKIVEDIRIEKVVTQFTWYTYRCDCCGEERITMHPELPREGIFGPTISGIWNSLHYKGNIPFDRLSQISGNLFDMEITPGGLHNVIYRTAQIFEPTFDEVKDEIAVSPYVRSDETSYPFNGDKWWLWNLSNQNSTLVVIRASRGSDVLVECLEDGRYRIINSDCFSAYDKFLADYQKCWAHILRYADKAAEYDPYAKKVHEMLVEMFVYIKMVKEKGLEGTPEVRRHIGIMKGKIGRLRVNKRRHIFANRLVGRLKKYNDSWFWCLIYKYVEPTNNISEGDIRKNVLARKISGQHRSELGVHSREIMMTMLLTNQRRGVNSFDFMNQEIRRYNSGYVGS